MTSWDVSDFSVNSLNEQQRLAVEAPLKPCLVVAGAGTGKTKVLIKRFEYLVKVKKIPVEGIVVVAYTNKAAGEMKKRISELFPDLDFLKKIRVSTFHQFCRDILISEQRRFRVCNEWMAVNCVKTAITKLNLPIKANNECTDLILRVKWLQNSEQKPATPWELIRAAKQCTNLTDEKLAQKYPFEDFKSVWMEYEKILKENSLLYHDDQLFEVDKLLRDEEKRSKWDAQIKAILFDEFQDIDPIQFRIIANLSKDIRNIFCVGDPDQAIYGFRDAMPGAFEKFTNYFKDSETIKLETNYRSTVEILNAVNELINKKKTVFSKNLVAFSKENHGEKVKLFISNTPNSEIEKIANDILDLQTKLQIGFENFAVLFRNWSFGWKLNEVFAQKRIPFFSEKLKIFWEREEIKDVLAYLYLSFENDAKIIDEYLKRIINKPARGLGKKTLEELQKDAKKLGISLIELIFLGQNSASYANCRKFAEEVLELRKIAEDEKINLRSRFEKIFEMSGIKRLYLRIDPLRVDNINFLLTFAFQEDLKNFDEFKKRLNELTILTTNNNGVYLSTIHSAKGLEFDYVFVMHMDEGKLPYKLEKTESGIDEERRLTYVAFTRAKKALFVSCSGGEKLISRFVKDIESQCIKSFGSFLRPSLKNLQESGFKKIS